MIATEFLPRTDAVEVGAARPLLSIIVPAYNEADGVGAFVQQLLACIAEHRQHVELLVVDGGSSDDTVAIVRSFAVRCLQGPRGRARQMNFAAAKARGLYLLFLHCDTVLPPCAFWRLQQAAVASDAWGFFGLALTGKGVAFRVIERAISLRSSLSGIGTGDQAIFVRRDLWQQIGGYGDMPLMEDVELCTRLRRLRRPLVVPERVLTSSRRWEDNGLLRTVLLMWFLRGSFFFGVNPAVLERWYG